MNQPESSIEEHYRARASAERSIAHMAVQQKDPKTPPPARRVPGDAVPILQSIYDASGPHDSPAPRTPTRPPGPMAPEPSAERAHSKGGQRH